MRTLARSRELEAHAAKNALAPAVRPAMTRRAGPALAHVNVLSMVSVVFSGITPAMALLQMGVFSKVRWWGNASLAVAMVPLPGLIGVLLAVMSLGRIDKTRQRGATIAVVGLNLGVACLLFAVMCWAAYGQVSRNLA